MSEADEKTGPFRRFIERIVDGQCVKVPANPCDDFEELPDGRVRIVL